MIENLVDTLGMVAGAVWISGALYFQFIREGDVHPAYVATLFMIGTALMLGSAAVAINSNQFTLELLGVLANLIFIGLGLAAWYGLEKYACLQEAKRIDPNERLDSY